MHEGCIPRRVYGIIWLRRCLLIRECMYKIEFTYEAEDELSEVYDYIALDNTFYAQEVLARIHRSITLLKEFPLIGTKICGDTRSIVEPYSRMRASDKVGANT